MAICIIHTGGTIAMRQGPNGLEPAEGVLQAGLNALSWAGIARDDVQLVQLAPLIDSANARFADWNRIGEIIFATQGQYAGFVVTHGTDTLAYTAAALSFALVGLARPVIVTGSMLPLEAAASDARQNLGDAILAATRAPVGVWVQFAGQLLAGTRVQKAHSHAFDAFTARAGAPSLRAGLPELLGYCAPEIAVLSMAPNTSARAFGAALAAVDGAVLRAFGAGTMPDNRAFEEAMMAATARGALMIAVSQCPSGGVALGTYAAGATMARAGVVDGRHMTESAAYAKLAHALSHGGRAVLANELCAEWS